MESVHEPETQQDDNTCDLAWLLPRRKLNSDAPATQQADDAFDFTRLPCCEEPATDSLAQRISGRAGSFRAEANSAFGLTYDHHQSPSQDYAVFSSRPHSSHPAHVLHPDALNHRQHPPPAFGAMDFDICAQQAGSPGGFDSGSHSLVGRNYTSTGSIEGHHAHRSQIHLSDAFNQSHSAHHLRLESGTYQGISASWAMGINIYAQQAGSSSHGGFESGSHSLHQTLAHTFSLNAPSQRQRPPAASWAGSRMPSSSDFECGTHVSERGSITPATRSSSNTERRASIASNDSELSVDADDAMPVSSSSTEQPTGWTKRSNHRREAVACLKKWLYKHAANPYPSEVEKHRLASMAGLTTQQVTYWFNNARKRSVHRLPPATSTDPEHSADSDSPTAGLLSPARHGPASPDRLVGILAGLEVEARKSVTDSGI